MKKKPAGRGRPSLGKNGRTKVVAVKFSAFEIAKLKAKIAEENREMVEDGNDDGQPATLSSWIRDHALDPLGLATFTPDD